MVRELWIRRLRVEEHGEVCQLLDQLVEGPVHLSCESGIVDVRRECVKAGIFELMAKTPIHRTQPPLETPPSCFDPPDSEGSLRPWWKGGATSSTHPQTLRRRPAAALKRGGPLPVKELGVGICPVHACVKCGETKAGF